MQNLLARCRALAAASVILVPLLVTACADTSGRVQTCPGDHTPVFDPLRHEALGCTIAPGNRVAAGSSCAMFRAGARTVDVAGIAFECSPAKGGLIWLKARYAEPTAEPETNCLHVGDFARAPDGGLMRCEWPQYFPPLAGPEIPQ